MLNSFLPKDNKKQSIFLLVILLILAVQFLEQKGWMQFPYLYKGNGSSEA